MIAKRIVVVVVIFGFVVGIMPLAYAREQKESIGIEPFFTHIDRVNATLSIDSNGLATMTGLVVGHAGTTQISANVVLYRVETNGTTTNIHSFAVTSTTSSIWLWEGTRFVVRGHTYRITVYASVHRNGAIESVAVSSGDVFAR